MAESQQRAVKRLKVVSPGGKTVLARVAIGEDDTPTPLLHKVAQEARTQVKHMACVKPSQIAQLPDNKLDANEH